MGSAAAKENNQEGDPLLLQPDQGVLAPIDTSPTLDTGVAIEGLSHVGAAPEPGRYEYTP